MEYHYTLLRVMFSEKARGLSGSLKDDVLSICKKKCFYYSKFQLDEGFRAMGNKGSNYLFGGTKPEHASIIEIFLHKEIKQEVKEEIINLARHGKDNISIGELPMSAYLFEPGTEEFIRNFEKLNLK